MALETELQTYKDHLAEMSQHEGKFVLIKGDQIIDYFVAYEDAIKEGYQKYGVTDAFLVKRVKAVEQVQFISRFAAPCESTAH